MMVVESHGIRVVNSTNVVIVNQSVYDENETAIYHVIVLAIYCKVH